MKIDRIIGIINFIQENGKTTMPYLAERFNVSRRTVCRDIDIICGCGIPIVTSQGVDGGIELKKGFYFDSNAFSAEELHEIFSGRRKLNSDGISLESGNFGRHFGEFTVPLSDNMLIDISSVYIDRLSDKISLLDGAIHDKKCVGFNYCVGDSEIEKKIEPQLIVFKNSAWFLLGFCKEQQKYKFYKLSRISDLKTLQEGFAARSVTYRDVVAGEAASDAIKIVAVFRPEAKCRLMEMRGADSYKVTKDGNLRTELNFSSYDKAFNWFLGFGSKARVIEPESFKNRLKEEFRKAAELYE